MCVTTHTYMKTMTKFMLPSLYHAPRYGRYFRETIIHCYLRHNKSTKKLLFYNFKHYFHAIRFSYHFYHIFLFTFVFSLYYVSYSFDILTIQ